MYLISGANLHGQWLKNDLVLSEFQNIPKTSKLGISYDMNQFKLVHIGWSYNLYRNVNKFFLSGSWHGYHNQLIEAPLPEDFHYYDIEDVLLIGNDYNLFWFDINIPVMWIMSLEDKASIRKVHLNTHINDTKELKKDHDIITKVCVSNINTMCLTTNGTVYSGLLPNPLQTNMCQSIIKDIQCGYEHSLLLTDSGQVFSWGNGRRLQLGHGNLENVEIPKLIKALAGIKIIKISAGGWHSLALSEFGDVYAWGRNDAGQLGVNRHTEDINMSQQSIITYDLPTLIDIIDENGDVVKTNVKHIACGTQHSAILLEDNSVWTSGCNKYGQTGFPLDDVQKLLSFKKCYQCCGDISIYCGPWVTVIEF